MNIRTTLPLAAGLLVANLLGGPSEAATPGAMPLLHDLYWVHHIHDALKVAKETGLPILIEGASTG